MTDLNVTKSREENQEPARENSKVAEVNMEAKKMSAEVAASAEEIISSEKVTEVTTELANENQSAEVKAPGEMVEITKELAEKYVRNAKTNSAGDKIVRIKKISSYTIERVGLISPDELESHGIIQRARVSGYICPLCGSGSGSKGTGMEYNKKVEDHTSFTCFGGGHAFNVLKLCALHYHMNTSKDYPKLLEKICEEFNIPIEYEDFSITSSNRVANKPRKSHNNDPLPPEELKYIQEDLNSSLMPLENFLRYQPEGKWRGFDFEFLKAHGCRLIVDWVSPKCRDKKQKVVPTTRMIIPSDDSSPVHSRKNACRQKNSVQRRRAEVKLG